MLRIAIIIGLLISAAGLGTLALLAMKPATSRPRTPAPVPMAKVMLLQKAKAAGVMLTKADVRIATMVAAQAPADRLQLADLSPGVLLRVDRTAGDVLRRSDILESDRGLLAGALAPGMRAITVAVDATTGAAGLIVPGSRVDLMLTQTVEQEDNRPPLVSAETVLVDLRVVAVDQQLVATNATQGAPTPRTISLEVTPRQALEISVAQQLGRVSFSVRPVEPAGTLPGPGGPPVYSRDISSSVFTSRPARGPSSSPAPSRRRSITVIEGSDVREVTLP